ncbi:DUF5696 domain-containing protein [Anaerocolumna sp. MB42-C2]|uniref:DUF5696 domain-containing protein n=1 Tax=Anaerocolumna sp. MB42-C2 TaxID=3070997 RepID=UPI0027E09325|nr:DUF5696 domain-containing protein [Anaerocolumna sp. MB42-C2]WMJ86794.1 DUF5696 domain-containing protein [Anaerocolumna sp. MB42-C2]
MTNKIKLKIVIKIILYLMILGGCCWFIYILQSSTQEDALNVKKWREKTIELIKSDTVLAAESDSLKLYFKEDTAEIWIEDKKTDEIWRSNPENAKSDKAAFGLNKTNILSQLIVGYIDDQSSSFIVNSFVGSVKKKTFDYRLADNGVYVTYYFNETGFEIPVYYGLKEDYFTADILCNKIVQHDSFKISNITFLPYMGCGSTKDTGYLVIPDGSGSIMNFNNQKQTYLSYSQPVYGRDNALSTLNITEKKENVTMPVFGIKRNDDAMLGIIAQGEYQAEIGAEVSGKTSSNNIVYSKIDFMQLDTNKLFANSNNEETSFMWTEQFNKFPKYEVRYYFLNQNATYTDMALRYQKYLVDEKGMTKLSQETEDKAKINVNLIGAVDKVATFLGVPYKTVEVLTSYSDVLRIANDLNSNSFIDLNLWYTGFLKDGIKSKLPAKIKLDNRLGGKSEFYKSIKELKSMGIGFYPSFNIVNMYQTGNGYYKTDSTRSVYRSAANQYEYLLSTGDKNSAISPTYLLSPSKVTGLSKKLLISIKKNNLTNLGLEGIANTMYSNYKKNGISRNETGSIFKDILAELDANTDSLLLDRAFGYSMPYADIITDTPVYSSEYDMEDASIPFYQIVMSGYATLYSEPVNMQGNIQDYLLKLAETGVNPNYKLIERDPSVLMNTQYSYLYSVGFNDWKDDIVTTAKRFSKLSVTYGQTITGHKEIVNGVFKTSYSNGAAVYTNYNNTEVSVDGVTIRAKDFIVRGDR